ncbi:tetratricopeptide repeat protein [Sphingosinicella rhizophila]|uniref:Tetratricopeptide repeat protein n=1 Tax=Sphingosinicella rhizophila TaxID=3050082 RepID=A0ABU3QCH9_9SPHN|nr:tetratricopeptide repeat protein [Sphingosinicella sp. GR2756]MDT9600640.1 tetratricopeptide repeat protein [Sphingosinicella sp. GR2756]
MSSDDDITAGLPRPPQPAPARREAAIATAMRRFDGEEAHAPAYGAAIRTGRPFPWPRLNRPHAGALLAASLVALVALPVAWNAMEKAPLERSRPAEMRDLASDDACRAEPSRAPEIIPQPSPADPSRLDSGMEPPAPAQVASSVPAGAGTPPDDEAKTAPAAPPPAPTADRVPAAPPATIRGIASENRPGPRLRQESFAADARKTERARISARAAPAPAAEQAEADHIVVTGARIEGRTPSQRGDWNACTVDDPSGDVTACRRQLEASGARGRAGAAIADGLARAWEGNEREAMAAFDRAIAIAPRSSPAYLNRGIAHRRNGDLDRALADLDRAVRYAPDSARAYYQRSLVHRLRGDRRRADADADKAAALDRRYEQLR